MAEDTKSIGSPVTLAELKLLGEFVRWQDIGTRVADLVAAKRLSNSYPLIASRLPANRIVDLCIDGHWRQIEFVRIEDSRLKGNRRVVYIDEGTEKTVPYNRYRIAPAGHFTEWAGPRPESLAGAKLLESFELAQH